MTEKGDKPVLVNKLRTVQRRGRHVVLKLVQSFIFPTTEMLKERSKILHERLG